MEYIGTKWSVAETEGLRVNSVSSVWMVQAMYCINVMCIDIVNKRNIDRRWSEKEMVPLWGCPH